MLVRSWITQNVTNFTKKQTEGNVKKGLTRPVIEYLEMKPVPALT